MANIESVATITVPRADHARLQRVFMTQSGPLVTNHGVWVQQLSGGFTARLVVVSNGDGPRASIVVRGPDDELVAGAVKENDQHPYLGCWRVGKCPSTRDGYRTMSFVINVGVPVREPIPEPTPISTATSKPGCGRWTDLVWSADSHVTPPSVRYGYIQQPQGLDETSDQSRSLFGL